MRSTRTRLLTVVGLAVVLAGVSVAPAMAKPHKDAGATTPSAEHDPPGNNGTIKIDGVPFDSAPDNEPHPGCVFQVDFYGFDDGPFMADLTFEAIAPTAGDVVRSDQVPIGEDSHAGGGSDAGLDASRSYDLSADLAGITPHPKQGWHVRLTIHADGSQGSDVKHKVFWVEDCAAVSGESLVPPAAPGAPDTNEGSAPDVAPPAATNASEVVGAEVLGESIARTNEATAQTTQGESLARTGMGLGLVVVAMGLIGGGALVLRSRAAVVRRSRPSAPTAS